MLKIDVKHKTMYEEKINIGTIKNPNPCPAKSKRPLIGI